MVWYVAGKFEISRFVKLLAALKRSVARVVIEPLKNSRPSLYIMIPATYKALWMQSRDDRQKKNEDEHIALLITRVGCWMGSCLKEGRNR